MIESRSDLARYLAADKQALGAISKYPLVTSNNSMVWLTDPIWRWTKALRTLEFWENCRTGPLYLPQRLLLRRHFVNLSIALGLSIPLNVCGPGLCVLHYGSIVISRHARLGSGCVLNSGVNIGMHRGGAPLIGNNVYIGPGAKLFGGIRIADNVKIGANAVVCQDCLVEGARILGIPGRIS